MITSDDATSRYGWLVDQLHGVQFTPVNQITPPTAMEVKLRNVSSEFVSYNLSRPTVRAVLPGAMDGRSAPPALVLKSLSLFPHNDSSEPPEETPD